MPSDPKEYRQNALRCTELAERATDSQLKAVLEKSGRALAEAGSRVGGRGGRNRSRNPMAKKRRVYQPRVFDGRIITSDEIERIHKEVLEFEHIEAISDPGAQFMARI